MGGNIYHIFFWFFFAMLILYGFTLVVQSRKSEAVQEAIASYTHAFIGAVIFTGAFLLAEAFATPNVPVNIEPVQEGILERVIAFLVVLVGAVLVANIVVQGIRLILAVNEGNIDTARKNFIQSLVGAAIAMLAKPILSLVRPGGFHLGINDEIVGVANFLGAIFGLMAVVTFIIAGIMLVVSVEDSLKDRAKKLIITSLVAMAVVVASLALLTILL
jgi:hypothetical protein